MKNLYKILTILLLTTFLTSCASIPEGDYIVYPVDGIITPATLEVQGRHFELVQGPMEITPTREETALPTIEATAVPKCTIAINQYNHNVRSQPNLNASIVFNVERTDHIPALSFYYEGTNEWAEVVNDGGRTGWLLIDWSLPVPYDPLGPCIDLPSNIQPTAVPIVTPDSTVPPLQYCDVTVRYNMNVRSEPLEGAPVVDRILSGSQVQVISFSRRSGQNYVFAKLADPPGYMAVSADWTIFGDNCKNLSGGNLLP